jgi:hypothetical protein
MWPRLRFSAVIARLGVFAGPERLERDQEKWSPVFRPIPLYTFENDHVHQLELIQLKLVVI